MRSVGIGVTGKIMTEFLDIEKCVRERQKQNLKERVNQLHKEFDQELMMQNNMNKLVLQHINYDGSVEVNLTIKNPYDMDDYLVKSYVNDFLRMVGCCEDK